MLKYGLYPAGKSPAVSYAAEQLKNRGILLLDAPQPGAAVLLDIPTRDVDLSLYPSMTVFAGSLKGAAKHGVTTYDLLDDELYLAKNAAITAHCALQVANEHLHMILPQAKCLVIGWGRIGKCLSKLLSAIGCDLTVCARKNADLGCLQSLGYSTVTPAHINLQAYDLVFSTVTQPLPFAPCNHTLMIDLSSIESLPGKDVIRARGLPGRYAPKSSGMLIAETVLRLSREDTI